VVGLATPDAVSAGSAWAWVLLAALAMFVVGFYDDRLQLSPIAKLVASLVIGAFLVFALSGAEPEGAPRSVELSLDPAEALLVGAFDTLCG
jgi:UDP-N-acetylmuramyl pentapeptide phosphotransferase/UDP-N-acetylglucosamine-1-phosphate transferase